VKGCWLLDSGVVAPSMYWVVNSLYFWNTFREDCFHPLNVEVMCCGSLMLMSWRSVSFTLIF